MTQVPVVYPASLPCPQTMVTAPAERRALATSSAPRDARALQRDRLSLEQVTFPPMLEADFVEFRRWWRDDLVLGGRWFSANWPTMRGSIAAIRRFRGAPRWSFIPGGFWQISAQLEVRGESLAPSVFESDASLLMLFEAAVGSQVFVDSIAGRVFEVVRNAGDFGSAAIEPVIAAVPKFGSTSVSFPENVGYHLASQNAAFCNFGTADFTVEFFIANTGGLFGSLPVFWIDSAFGTSVPAMNVALDGSSGNLTAEVNESGLVGVALAANGLIGGSSYHHVAVQRSGDDVQLMIDGALRDSEAVPPGTVFGGEQGDGFLTRIGSGQQANSGQFRGYIDSLRITPGFALYGASYTVPTRELR